jgi:CubicO group peptidase (beta-lactamase class C family)
MNLESVVNQRWAEFSEARQLFLPGIVFSYEHAAYGVVGEALQVILGQNLDTILFERLLEPLGFSSGKLGDDRCSDIPNVVGHEYNAQTRTFVPAVVQTFPSNGALSCVTMSFQDLAMLAQTLATRAVAVGSAAGINCQSVSLLETRHACLPALVEGTKPIGLPIGFGLGCAHYSNGLFGFDGSFMGQACGIRYDPIQRIGIVVGVNVASSNVRSGVIDAILRSIGLVDDIAATHMRREYDFDLELLPGLYVGADHSEVLIARSAGMFSFDFKLSGRATRLKLTTRYDPQLNRIFVTGAGQQCGLAVFLEPGGQHPCVAMGLTVYKKQYLVDGEPT